MKGITKGLFLVSSLIGFTIGLLLSTKKSKEKRGEYDLSDMKSSFEKAKKGEQMVKIISSFEDLLQKLKNTACKCKAKQDA